MSPTVTEASTGNQFRFMLIMFTDTFPFHFLDTNLKAAHFPQDIDRLEKHFYKLVYIKSVTY